VSPFAQTQHAARSIVSLRDAPVQPKSGLMAIGVSARKGSVNPMATSQVVIAPKRSLNALLAAAAIEQDSAKLSELTDQILAAFERGESVRFANS
jgi:hypothetical protein